MSTILVVEDEHQLARLAELNLTAEGYQVVIYHEGRAAWTYLQDHRPDLIILDLMLPTVSGWDLLVYLRREERLLDVPVLALSALARPEEKGRALAAGAAAYLVKPFSLRQLLDLVRQLMAPAHET
ncbi:MAG TPA: response regulator [Anaerolineae bacterium]